MFQTERDPQGLNLTLCSLQDYLNLNHVINNIFHKLHKLWQADKIETYTLSLIHENN